MKDLLSTINECIVKFALQSGGTLLGAIIGGEAVILHGVPRTTLDLDILLFCGDEDRNIEKLCVRLADFLKIELGSNFKIEAFEAAKDPFDPIHHDLIIITDNRSQFKKMDILIANYQWELEGLRKTDFAATGFLQPLPKPYLVGMKLKAGGAQDEADIRNLFLIMSEEEKKETLAIARRVRRDRNFERIISDTRR